MFIEDTIVAVSSAAAEPGQTARSIIRLSGAGVWQAMERIVAEMPSPAANTVRPCRVRVCPGLELEAMLYCFCTPHSYTGEDLAELHLWAAADVVEYLLKVLCQDTAARLARPGEFTLRAYLNGKMDLTQAEAVAQIVSSANTLQLAAAEKLLHGRFSETIAAVRTEILELLGLLEAGLDFTEEDITFIAVEQATQRIIAQHDRLRQLLDNCIRMERMIDLDSVGLAGLSNAGKSSLLNALLGTARSIVSPLESTTRDVLTGVLELDNSSCVLFDCAGLSAEAEPHNAVDRLAHQAAIDALQQAAVVLFCMDAATTSLEANLKILSHVKAATVIPVATQADTVDSEQLASFLTQAQPLFAAPITVTSSRTGQGLAALKQTLENALISGRSGHAHADRLTLNQRHRQRLEEAVKTLAAAVDEINAGRDEVAAMLLRQAYETLGGLEHEDVSEKILDSIFSRFCIGK